MPPSSAGSTARRSGFNFKKAVVINPAVNLYDSVNRLDKMVDRQLGRGSRGRQPSSSTTCSIKSRRFTIPSDQVDFADPAFIYRAYAVLEPPERELELLIGLAFRLTSNDMAFTSDVMTNVRLRRAQERAADRHDLADRRDARGPAAELRQLLRRGLRAACARARARRHPRANSSPGPACGRSRAICAGIPAWSCWAPQDDVILSREEVLWLRGRIRRAGADLPDRRALRQHGPARVRRRDAPADLLDAEARS